MLFPFSTLGAALASVPACSSFLECRRQYVIHVQPCSYDEDLVINVTRRSLVMQALGTVTIGNLTGPQWSAGPGDVARNITIFSSDDFGGNMTTGVQLLGLDDVAGSEFRVSGNVLVDASGTNGAYLELRLRADVLGTVNVTSGLVELDAQGAHFHGPVLGPAATNASQLAYERCSGSQHDAAVNVTQIGSLNMCSFGAGFALATNASSNSVRPRGFYNCFFAGQLGGPANFPVDSGTDYWITSQNLALVGGATKTVQASMT